MLVQDIVAGPGSSSPSWLTAVGGKLFFAASSDDVNGSSLWMATPGELTTTLLGGGLRGDAPVSGSAPRTYWDHALRDAIFEGFGAPARLLSEQSGLVDQQWHFLGRNPGSMAWLRQLSINDHFSLAIGPSGPDNPEWFNPPR